MEQDWLWGLVGGLMIGAGAAIYLLVNGRVLGASGIFGGLIDGSGRDTLGERVAFLGGLIAVPALLVPLYRVVDTHATERPGVLILAGLAVGIGTRLANGCTSGHGVCGMSRFSLRSFTATALYLIGGGLAVIVARHLLGIV